MKHITNIVAILAAVLLIHSGSIAVYSAYLTRKIMGELLVIGLAILFLRSLRK
jgi:uncharacterized membrane protein